jgi:Family of unknown function (DUF6496)
MQRKLGRRLLMPEKKTLEKARRAKREGKAPSTQAGEFIREEIRKIRRGEHGARSPEQAIAIGLSEARRAGVDLPPPRKGTVKESTRKSAEYAYEAGQHERKPKHRPRVAHAVFEVLKKEPWDTASHEILSRHATKAAARRTSSERSAAAKEGRQPRVRKGGPSQRAKRRKRASAARNDNGTPGLSID